MNFMYNGHEFSGCGDGDIYYNGGLVKKIFYNGVQVYQRYNHNYHQDIRTCYRNVNCSYSSTMYLKESFSYSEKKTGAFKTVYGESALSGWGDYSSFSGPYHCFYICGSNGVISCQRYTDSAGTGFNTISNTSKYYSGHIKSAVSYGCAYACVNYNGHTGNTVPLSVSNGITSAVSTACWTETQPYTVDCSYHTWDPA